MSTPHPTIEDRLFNIRHALAVIQAACVGVRDTRLNQEEILAGIKMTAFQAFEHVRALGAALEGEIQNRPSPAPAATRAHMTYVVQSEKGAA